MQQSGSGMDRRTFLARAGAAGMIASRLGAPTAADGAQNYSFWSNPAFHDLARQIEREVDDGKRRALVRQAEGILEQDPPLLPVAYEKIYDAWHTKVHGQNPAGFFGIYDVVRWDTVWLAG